MKIRELLFVLLAATSTVGCASIGNSIGDLQTALSGQGREAKKPTGCWPVGMEYDIDENGNPKTIPDEETGCRLAGAHQQAAYNEIMRQNDKYRGNQ